jgi:hypothetical protein
MASALQIQANRLNSQKSTGPRSPEGKAAVRFNALKSGIHANSGVIPGEDPVELEELARGYHEQFQPATPLECFLVDTLVQADWQLRRLHRVEAQLWAHQLSQTSDTDTPLGEIYCRALDTFTRLQRRIDSTGRSYYRALTQLQRLPRDVALPEPVPGPEPQASAADAELASFCAIPKAGPGSGLDAPPFCAAGPTSPPDAARSGRFPGR